MALVIQSCWNRFPGQISGAVEPAAWATLASPFAARNVRGCENYLRRCVCEANPTLMTNSNMGGGVRNTRQDSEPGVGRSLVGRGLPERGLGRTSVPLAAPDAAEMGLRSQAGQARQGPARLETATADSMSDGAGSTGLGPAPSSLRPTPAVFRPISQEDWAEVPPLIGPQQHFARAGLPDVPHKQNTSSS